jgi:Zn-dependent metalloprotease
MTEFGKARTAVGALVLTVLFLATGAGRAGLAPGPDNRGTQVRATRGERAETLSRLIDRRVSAGTLRLAAVQSEAGGARVHERYDVCSRGLKVWGAQVLRHRENGEVYLVDGDLRTGEPGDVAPAFGPSRAGELARTGLIDRAYRLEGSPELMLYPAREGLRPAFRAAHAKFGSRIVTFVDAATGGLLFRFEDLRTSTAIGTGTGMLGDTKKMSTTLENGTYYAIDQMRPAAITTGSCRNGTGTVYYVTDDDNVWTSDATVVDGHAYMGWTYDYYYLVHGRKGMDDKNRELVLSVHLGNHYENAFFDPGSKWMFFGDGNPSTRYPYTTALDVVAHEFTHGVTDATSNLIYAGESGALNEAFSDIMAASCEFFHQAAGSGFLQAEWWVGEDCAKNHQPMRSMANPAGIHVWGGAYPDHYSKRWILPVTEAGDWGGVHLNSTIASHWFYLLSQGGTNRTSGIAVDGIGLAKAEKIAYAAWAHYLRPSSDFGGARAACVQAAADLHGAGSPEATATALAWSAVGVN